MKKTIQELALPFGIAASLLGACYGSSVVEEKFGPHHPKTEHKKPPGYDDPILIMP